MECLSELGSYDIPSRMSILFRDMIAFRKDVSCGFFARCHTDVFNKYGCDIRKHIQDGWDLSASLRYVLGSPYFHKKRLQQTLITQPQNLLYTSINTKL